MIVEPKFQTSFIPKKPIVGGPSVERVSVNFFSIIALAIFLVSIALAAGAFAYSKIVAKQIDDSNQQLEIVKKQFDPAFITEATRLNARIEAAKTLLANHIAPSFIFTDLIQQYTLKDEIAFSSFDWNYDVAGKGTITMKGVAKNYTSVALQAREFAAHIQYLKNQVFSDLSLDQNGNVSFSFKGTIDPGLINFKNKRSVSTTNTTQ